MADGDLFDKKLLVVVGKGGVGKTTTAAAIGLAAAARGKRVLIAMCNTKDQLSALLETPPIGDEVQNLLPNLDAVNMEPGAALREYGLMILKVKAIFRAVFDNRIVAAFLRGTPGIDAWAMLGKAVFHALAEDDQGQPVYDLVILDAPATGHGLSMLRVPRVIAELAPPGLLRREAAKAETLLRDAERSGAVVVTLPEVMPTNETLELCQQLRDDIGLQIERIVTNRVLPALFDPSEIPALQRIASANAPKLGDVPRAAFDRARREQVQAESIARLSKAVSAPRTVFPVLYDRKFGRQAVESLSSLI